MYAHGILPSPPLAQSPKPELLVCDEAVSALDVSIRAQILNLLEAMKARYRLALLFIAHDLAVVKAVSDRVAVMYLGRLCEVGPIEALYREPAHPYTALLFEAIPVPDPAVRPPQSVPVGEPPSPLAPPSGCRFRTRCARADRRCAEVKTEPVRPPPPPSGPNHRHGRNRSPGCGPRIAQLVQPILKGDALGT
jgi:oligopeptide/dipeptide ABC transporter ATP-binding protein